MFTAYDSSYNVYDSIEGADLMEMDLMQLYPMNLRLSPAQKVKYVTRTGNNICAESALLKQFVYGGQGSEILAFALVYRYFARADRAIFMGGRGELKTRELELFQFTFEIICVQTAVKKSP